MKILLQASRLICCIPVILSGIGSLFLKKTETDLHGHYIKYNDENLIRLHSGSADCVVYFLAGILPGKAQVHMRQLFNFAMICRLPDSVLHRHARNVLITSKSSCQSWFLLCIIYELPHPLQLQVFPGTKNSFKKLIKKKLGSRTETPG